LKPSDWHERKQTLLVHVEEVERRLELLLVDVDASEFIAGNLRPNDNMSCRRMGAGARALSILPPLASSLSAMFKPG
jgi:hypothetical protein